MEESKKEELEVVQNSELTETDENGVTEIIRNAKSDAGLLKKAKRAYLIAAGLSIFLLIATVPLLLFWAGNKLSDAAVNSAKKAEEAYSTTKTDTANAIITPAYQVAYQRAEKENHVANEVSIVVDSLQLKSDLRVLEVYDVEYSIHTADSNEAKIDSWLMIPGKGAFTVDMKAAEFIIDEERDYVLVRVPRPELKNCGIIYEEVKKLLYENGGCKEDPDFGEEQARNQLEEGFLLIQERLCSDPMFYNSAENAARNIITSMVKALNLDVKNLTVDVEFIR